MFKETVYNSKIAGYNEHFINKRLEKINHGKTFAKTQLAGKFSKYYVLKGKESFLFQHSSQCL